jgi:hypothetical protein
VLCRSAREREREREKETENIIIEIYLDLNLPKSKKYDCQCRSQWPRGLRHRYAAARLLKLCARILPWARMSVSCECCVSSGRVLCDELITRPEESYRLWYVAVCDLENS